MPIFLASLPMLLGMGLAGVLHCAGMCGGLAALAGSRRPARLLAYLAGKTGVYMFLGALAGAAGRALVSAAPFDLGRRALAVAAGVVLLLAGLDALRLVRLSASASRLSALARPLGRLAGEGASGALVLGAINAFLPCPMTMAFLALAAGTGSPLWGAATLFVLALTSAAPLGTCALLGYRLGRWRAFPSRSIAGAIMLVMAALTLWRGLGMTELSHH